LRSRGGQVGARALGRRPWRRISTLFAVILNVILSRNLDQRMLKNAYFLGKNCKNLPPTITTLSSLFLMLNAFYFAKKSSNYSKCSAFASFALLHLFFNSNSISFVEGRRKNIFCPRAQGTLATLLVPIKTTYQSIGNSLNFPIFTKAILAILLHVLRRKSLFSGEKCVSKKALQFEEIKVQLYKSAFDKFSLAYSIIGTSRACEFLCFYSAVFLLADESKFSLFCK